MVATRPASPFPARGGTYVLMLKARSTRICRIGRLGAVTVPAGTLFYVGSALGPGGLRARLTRHTRPVERRHWHVDYLRQVAAVAGVYWLADGERHEHVLAAALARAPGLEVPLPGFGASDCRCSAHLFRRDPERTRPDIATVIADACGIGRDQVQRWLPPAMFVGDNRNGP